MRRRRLKIKPRAQRIPICQAAVDVKGQAPQEFQGLIRWSELHKMIQLPCSHWFVSAMSVFFSNFMVKHDSPSMLIIPPLDLVSMPSPSPETLQVRSSTQETRWSTSAWARADGFQPRPWGRAWMSQQKGKSSWNRSDKTSEQLFYHWSIYIYIYIDIDHILIIHILIKLLIYYLQLECRMM